MSKEREREVQTTLQTKATLNQPTGPSPPLDLKAPMYVRIYCGTFCHVTGDQRSSAIYTHHRRTRVWWATDGMAS